MDDSLDFIERFLGQEKGHNIIFRYKLDKATLEKVLPTFVVGISIDADDIFLTRLIELPHKSTANEPRCPGDDDHITPFVIAQSSRGSDRTQVRGFFGVNEVFYLKLGSIEGTSVVIHITEFDYELILAKKPKKKLMVVLHGRGDSLKPFRDFDEELKVPGLNYLLINASRPYDTGYTWYAFPPHQAKGILLARKKLTRMMRELEKQGWKSKDIFFLGFSQGSLVSCDFAMHYDKPLGGVIGISGYIYFFNNWRRHLKPSSFRTPILLTHGTKDDALAIDETREDVKRLQAAGLKIKWKEFNKDHEIDERRELPFIRKWVLDKL